VLLLTVLVIRRDSFRYAFVDDTLYQPEIREAAARYCVPHQLVRALIYRESRFRADARGSAGEVGLMQVLPSGAAADWARVNKRRPPTVRELENVRINLDVGCFFLARGFRRWRNYRGQKALALCQYNAGESRAVRWAPADPQDPEILSRITIVSTREYVRTILARYERYCGEVE